MDIADVVASVDIVKVVSNHVHLTKDGAEYVGMCPFHNDTNPSLKVNIRKQVAKCFVCGNKAMNAYSFLRKLGHTHGEAMDELTGSDIYNSIPDKTILEHEVYTPVLPIPAPAPSLTHYKFGLPHGNWTYRDAYGNDMMYVLRFDIHGGKEIRYMTHDGERFRWKCIPKNRPLYNLHRFNKYIGNNILFTTWIGGARAVRKTDWSPLDGKNVILLGDNDQVGEEAMDDIYSLLKPKSIFRVNIPTIYPRKWDIADKEWEGNELYNFIIKNIIR